MQVRSRIQAALTYKVCENFEHLSAAPCHSSFKQSAHALNVNNKVDVGGAALWSSKHLIIKWPVLIDYGNKSGGNFEYTAL